MLRQAPARQHVAIFARLVSRRLLLLPAVMVLALALTFALTRMTHGDPLARVRSPFMTPDQVQSLRSQYHLNEPLAQQFLSYLADAVHGDFGESFTTSHAVGRDLADRLPVTLELAVGGMAIGILLGVGLGIGGALRPGGLIDTLGRGVVLITLSVPVFWSSLLLLVVFYYQLGWLPGPGLNMATDTVPRVTGIPILDAMITGNPTLVGATSKALVLPATALGLSLVPLMARISRQALGEAMESEFVATAYCFGLSRRTVLLQHVLPVAAPPILTTIGTLIGFAIGGDILVEIVFSWPGLGTYAYNAILASDFPAIEGFVLLVTVLYVVIFLLVDLLAAWLDPRRELVQS